MGIIVGMIKKEGNKWVLYDHTGKKKLGTHPSEKSAKKQEMAINISKVKEGRHGR